MDKTEKFIDKLNMILSDADFHKLDQSCNGSDLSYTKELLSQMHNAFISVYGNSTLGMEEKFVTVPCVFQSKDTGYLTLGVADIDLSSAGELWGAEFFTPFGVLYYGKKDMSKEAEGFLRGTIGRYNYWYTPSVERDIHVNFEDIPQKGSELLNSCLDNGPSPNDQNFKLEL